MLSFSWCRGGFLSVRKKVGKTAAFAAAFPTFFGFPCYSGTPSIPRRSRPPGPISPASSALLRRSSTSPML